MERFEICPRLTVAEAKAIFNSPEAPPRIDELGEWGTPAYLIVDANRKLLKEHLDRRGVTADGILRDLRAAARRLGPGLGCSEYRQMEKRFETARKALEEEQVRMAARTIRDLETRKPVPDPMKQEIGMLRKELERVVDRQIRNALDNADSHPKLMRELLEDLVKDLQGDPLQEKAREALRKFPHQ